MAAAADGSAMTGQRIAVVDDDPRIRQFLEEELNEHGFETHCFNDGQALLDNVESVAPDLVLLDLMMPHVPGLECLKRLRQSGFQAPVIIFTALSDNAFRRMAELDGANEYVLKPDLFDNPLRVIRRHLPA
ncbi:MAG: response regulator [Prochlorococcaceae cyanobacterium]